MRGIFMDVTILIVNWNTRKLLQDCLQSIEYFLNGKVKYEVIVVDNGSTDGSVDMVKNDFPSVIILANKENLGFVRANNQGAALARGRYILLLNSDTVLLDGGIKEIVFYMDTHADVGVATGRVLYPDQTFQRPFRRFPHWSGAVFRHTIQLIAKVKPPFEKRFRLEHLDENIKHEVDWVCGAYMFVRKELVDRGKVFDKDIFMWSEDTLLCHNIRSRGYQVVYLPCAPIIHYAGESRNKVPVESAYNSFRGSVIYFKKTHGESVARFYCLAVRYIWTVFAIIFMFLQFIPLPRFEEKAKLFSSLVSKGPVL